MNYRKYLRDFQEMNHKKNTKFTQGYICKLLGLPNTRSYFNDVLKNKNLTRRFQEKLLDNIMPNLDEMEGNYFRALVGYNQSANKGERGFYNFILEYLRNGKRLNNEF